MKLTKLEHACVILEQEEQRLIIDPGVFTTLPTDVSNVAAVIVTHIHPDHCDPTKLDAILAANPSARIFGSREVASERAGTEIPKNETAYEIGPFNLEFYGDMHEAIRPGLPQVHNLGVVINSLIAYGGDSYARTSRSVKLLLAPASAPWLRAKEAVELITQAEAEIIIPTHDALLSEAGQQIYDAHYQSAAEASGKSYRRLAIGETIEV
jgi:L-ascorbate metabolism protein UlaG (beta-lactamase superfamily)